MTYEEALAVATANNEIDENQTFLIDKNLRTVTIPDGFVLGVFNDKNVQIVPFAMPRYYNGIDMSLFAIQINYVNSNGDGDIYLVFEKDVQDDLILFNWVVDRTAFATTGRTGFVVCMKEDDEYGYVEREFNTTLTYAPVLEGLEIENPIDDQTAMDILTQIIQAANRADEAADDAEASSNSAGASASNASSSASSASTSASNASASATAAAASAATASSAETNAVSARDAAIEAAETATEAAAELSTGAAIPNALFNKTAWSDDIVKIYDGADGVPIRSLVADITPTQDLHGLPNPYPPGGGKNLLQVTATSATVYGITYTVNNDGTISAVGTATTTNRAVFDVGHAVLPSGTYTISGCPSGGADSTYRIRLGSGSYTGTAIAQDFGNGASFTLAEQTDVYARIYIQPASGAVNQIWKPMIEVGSTKTDFAPYSNICPITGRTGMTVTRANKNLAPNYAGQLPHTSGGITWTYNDDGSITLDGTATSNVYSRAVEGLNYKIYLPHGTYKKPVMQIDASHIVGLFVQYVRSGSDWVTVTGGGFSSTTFTIDEDYPIVIRVAVQNGATVDNVRFEPYVYPDSVNDLTWVSPAKTTYPISWQTQAGTIYGGTLDVVSGVLTVTHAAVQIKDKTWTYDATNTRFGAPFLPDIAIEATRRQLILCDAFASFTGGGAVSSVPNNSIYNGGTDGRLYIKTDTATTAVDFVSTYGDYHIVFPLATPQVIQLSPTEIKTLKDFNQIYSDIGKVTVNYIADTEDAATDVMYKALVTDSASGNIAAFEDGAGNAPLESLISQITPIQDLNGQSNPYPPGGGKNLLNNTSSSTTFNGITWTVNSDGTVTANGTATAESIFVVVIGADELPRETNLYFSGCPSGGSASKYNVYILDNTTHARAKKWNNITAIDNDTGASANNELYLTSNHEYQYNMRVMSGQTVSNIVFSPMIRLATESDGTFAPYSNICPISGRTGMTVTRSGKNLLKLPYAEDTKTQNGITFTVNDDGSVRVAGTATGTATLILANTAALNELPFLGSDVTVTLSGCPSGGSGSTYYMAANLAGDNTGDVGASNLADTGAGDTKYYTNTHVKSGGNLFIRVSSGVTIDKVFYPMLALADSVSEWEPPKDNKIISVSWESIAGTVYGGSVDVISGKLTVEYGAITFDGTQTLTDKISSADRAYMQVSGMAAKAMLNDPLVTCNRLPKTAAYQNASRACVCIGHDSTGNYIYLQGVSYLDGVTDLATFNAWLADNPVMCTYELAKPQIIQLSPTEIRSLLGGNTIYSDAGSVSVDYRADTKLYINKKIAEALA